MLTLHADILSALAGDSFEYAYMCELPAGLYFTNHAKDVTYNGNTYVSNGLLASFDNIKKSQELNLSSYKVGLSNIDNSIAKGYLATNYRGSPAVVYLAVMLDGVIQGAPIIIYKGTLDSFSVRENRTSSDLSLRLTSHWASYNQKAGRYSSDTLQQDIHAGDRIFKYAHAEKNSIGWGKR